MFFLLANSLSDFLGIELVVVGLVLAAVGFASSLLAKRITQAVRDNKQVEQNDKIMLSIKAFGLICIVIALILIILAVN